MNNQNNPFPLIQYDIPPRKHGGCKVGDICGSPPSHLLDSLAQAVALQGDESGL